MNYNQPAPYELQQNQYAKGGRAKSRNGHQIVHMNKKEMDILDHIQGHSEKKGHGEHAVRSYSALEHLIKNPHIASRIHHHSHAQKAQHHASGGSATSMEHLREGGRFGDTELAVIGPKTKELFDTLAGNPMPNPNTGHPEYWSLGGALGGLWDTIKGGAQSLAPHVQGFVQNALPQIMPMAQKALGDNFGDLGKMAGNALPGLANSLMGPQQAQQPGQAGQALGQGLSTGLQAMQSGQSPRQAFGQGMQTAGQRYGGALGGAAANTGSNLAAGNGLGQSLRSGAGAGFNQMGGTQRLGEIANNAYGAFNRGGPQAAQQALRGQASQMGRRAMPQQMQDHEDLGQYGQNMFNSPY